jgi:TM2 domain-containing membrane protein YozV
MGQTSDNRCERCGANLQNGVCLSCGWTTPQSQAQQPQQSATPAPIVVNVQPQQQYAPAPQQQYAPAPQQQYAPAPQQTKPVSKIAYILVTFFLGFLGVHRFMRGQVGIGILYFFTVGGFGIGWLIDFIVSLTKLSHYPNTGNYEFLLAPRGYWSK